MKPRNDTKRTGSPIGSDESVPSCHDMQSADCPTRCPLSVATGCASSHPKVCTRPEGRVVNGRLHGCRDVVLPCSPHRLQSKRCSSRGISRGLAAAPKSGSGLRIAPVNPGRSDADEPDASPPLWFITARPSTVHPQPCPLPQERMPSLRPVGTTRTRSRSALVVSHHPDGLLHVCARRSVA